MLLSLRKRSKCSKKKNNCKEILKISDTTSIIKFTIFLFMKKNLTRILLCFLAVCSPRSIAQNVFPATGNVGIGTTNPQSTLDVRGNALLQTSSDPVLTFNKIGTSWQYVEFKNSNVRQSWMGLNESNHFI